MGGFSVVHIIILGIIVLILFGSDKLPIFGKSLGKAIKGFKDGINEIDVDSKDVTTEKLNAQQIAELKLKQVEMKLEQAELKLRQAESDKNKA